jgi:hypothetical protein
MGGVEGATISSATRPEALTSRVRAPSTNIRGPVFHRLHSCRRVEACAAKYSHTADT